MTIKQCLVFQDLFYGLAYGQFWKTFNVHLKIAKYLQLLDVVLPEAFNTTELKLTIFGDN